MAEERSNLFKRIYIGIFGSPLYFHGQLRFWDLRYFLALEELLFVFVKVDVTLFD